MKLASAALAAAALTLGACTADAPPPDAPRDGPAAVAAAPPADPAVDPRDSTLAPALAGADGWNYQQSAEADLDGDGTPERVVLTARVELYRGRPAWDDGQPWQVYVEGADGGRTYLYARRLQLGTLTMRVGRGEPGRPASVVLLEHLPDRLTLFEATYQGPGRTTVRERFQRQLDPTGETASPALP